ncbi:MAG: methylthioadenosine phosphorylase [Gammaproteobacteria bacterium RIFCSPLOWO2_02_FULL_61_13]|nr:MAG: methylthioadenosine phosphorylase [Gammaproteobacteria bacterium RIFCSPLOWO2_02_FULL_61_13]
MTHLGIIGGSGLTALAGLRVLRRQVEQTPWGEPSGPLVVGEFAGREIFFLPRHGQPHAIPPHMINYRANLWALKENGVRRVVAVNAVGGISAGLGQGTLMIPDQIIDYTWSRAHTFFESGLDQVTHADFTTPYSIEMRNLLISAATKLGLPVHTSGTYGATQGPRLETAAEITRMERDGCHVVGMTGMPEAALARELDVGYAAVCVVANRAAGKSPEPITMDLIRKNLDQGMKQTLQLLQAVIPLL